jgi:hypothetical protein
MRVCNRPMRTVKPNRDLLVCCGRIPNFQRSMQSPIWGQRWRQHVPLLTLVCYRIKRPHKPEDLDFNLYCRENLKYPNEINLPRLLEVMKLLSVLTHILAIPFRQVKVDTKNFMSNFRNFIPDAFLQQVLSTWVRLYTLAFNVTRK